jgi:TrmH family RNA methyltransferase
LTAGPVTVINNKELKNMRAPLKPLKWYRALGEKKGRLEARAFLVEGDRALRQIVAGHPYAVLEIITIEGANPLYKDYPIRSVTESQFHYISGTRTPQGVMAVVRLPPDIYTSRLPRDIGDKILLLEDIQDPGNTGTLIRTAAAFGFDGVIMTENSADPFSPKCVQSTAGAVLSVWLRRTPNYLELAQDLKNKNYRLVAADLAGNVAPEVLNDVKKLLLALGNEAVGLSKALLDMADDRLRIPVAREKAESLNVSACGAILMYLNSGR